MHGMHSIEAGDATSCGLQLSHSCELSVLDLYFPAEQAAQAVPEGIAVAVEKYPGLQTQPALSDPFLVVLWN
jgi:hypothetical protein